MRGWMTAVACVGTMLVSGCVGVFAGTPSFSALQATCGGAQPDYGADAQPVYSALFDAYVAHRHGRLSQGDYCGFESDIASHYRAREAGGPDAKRVWAEYFNAQRAKAIGWRAQVDPTLRGG
ncbi:hypothetical protein [Trinickia acidisoli]|uniref:hypothetical protein n=1 Tax=Trinickia acidisoli TaxID=2767482 RepID=UPI001A8CC66B|nr:hypothetical protein [Trinickia acidisoli]